MANEKLTKNERREQAREQARLAREAEKKREQRRRWMLQGGVVLGVLAVLAIVGIVFLQTMKPAGPGPRNMASGGVVLEEGLKVVTGPALESGADRVAPTVDRTQAPLDITVYVDYSCTHCADFEQAYGPLLENWVDNGEATLQVYPVNTLGPQGTSHSTRAGNLVACVVDQNPSAGVVFDLHNRLLSSAVYSKAMQNGGLTQDELIEQAQLAGANINDELKQCVKDVRFASFISQNTKAATETGVLGLAEGVQLVDFEANGQVAYQAADGPQRLRGTPLIIVNGKEWRSNRDGDLSTYLAKVKAELSGNGADSADDSADADKADESK